MTFLRQSTGVVGSGTLGAAPVGLYLRPIPAFVAPPPPSPPPTLPDGTLAYPVSLPGPSQPLTFEPAERRQSVGRPGPWALRAYARERIGTVRATFVLSQAEAAAFRLWWAQDLTQGGAWFAAEWPNPYGASAMAYCFTEPPQWEHQGRGIWRVSASLEYRPQPTV